MADEPSDHTADTGASPELADAARELLGNTALTRGQVIHAGVELGIIERLGPEPTSADAVATDLELDPEHTYRLLRALGAYGVLEEHRERRFSLTPIGEHYQADHPESLRDFTLYALGPERHAARQHLPAIVAEGGPDGYEREYGCGFFEYCEQNPSFAEHFNGTQNRLTSAVTRVVLDALSSDDFSGVSTVCDIGGGHGHLLCHILEAYPQLEGTILELPSVVAEHDHHWAPKLDVEDRCTYVAGDMFDAVPEADAYIMKHVLHDWSDDDCVRILSTVNRAAPDDGRLFVVENVVQERDPSVPTVHLDMVMLMETGGRERTSTEYAALFEQGGWKLAEVRGTDEVVSIVEGVNA